VILTSGRRRPEAGVHLRNCDILAEAHQPVDHGLPAKISVRLQLGTHAARRHPGAVSLNRCEEAFLHYLRSHPDEHRFWHARVLAAAREPGPADARTAELERALRAYAAERTRSDAAQGDALGAGRVSLRNLAEYLLRTWPPPPPLKRPAVR
jgi:hypothetical protein